MVGRTRRPARTRKGISSKLSKTRDRRSSRTERKWPMMTPLTKPIPALLTRFYSHPEARLRDHPDRLRWVFSFHHDPSPDPLVQALAGHRHRSDCGFGGDSDEALRAIGGSPPEKEKLILTEIRSAVRSFPRTTRPFRMVEGFPQLTDGRDRGIPPSGHGSTGGSTLPGIVTASCSVFHTRVLSIVVG